MKHKKNPPKNPPKKSKKSCDSVMHAGYKISMFKILNNCLSGTTQSDFDLHMTCHFEHVCPHCDYKSRTEGRLKRHIKDFHTDDGEFGNRTMPGRPKVFKCKQCDYSTTEKVSNVLLLVKSPG